RIGDRIAEYGVNRRTAHRIPHYADLVGVIVVRCRNTRRSRRNIAARSGRCRTIAITVKEYWCKRNGQKNTHYKMSHLKNSVFFVGLTVIREDGNVPKTLDEMISKKAV